MNEAPRAVLAIRTVAQAGTLPGLISAIRFSPDGTPDELGIDLPPAIAGDGWCWLHFNLADSRAAPFLRSAGYFPPAVTALLTDPDEHQQLDARDGCPTEYSPISSAACTECDDLFRLKRTGLLKR